MTGFSSPQQLDRRLRKKAGLAVVPSYNALRHSEYQRQFVWEARKEAAPVSAASQVVDSCDVSAHASLLVMRTHAELRAGRKLGLT